MSPNDSSPTENSPDKRSDSAANSTPQIVANGGSNPAAAPSASPPPDRAPTAPRTTPSVVIETAKDEFLIAPKQSAGGLPPAFHAAMANLVGAAAPASFSLEGLTASVRLTALAEQLASPDIEVIERVSPSGLAAMDSAAAPAPPSFIVARMTLDKAAAMIEASSGEYNIVHNQPLKLADIGSFDASPVMYDPAVTAVAGGRYTFSIGVEGDGAQLAGTEIIVYGSTSTTQGVTDASGVANFALGSESASTIQGLLIRPAANYWNLLIRNPKINNNAINTVTVKSLSATLQGFPNSELIGWGQRAMGMDRVPANMRGQGIRVAIVDSGVDARHRDLTGVSKGFDFPLNDPNGWVNDSIGHGSHCAGVICGTDNGSGIRGFAPGVELHALRILPEGRIDDLVKALQYCIENSIDVVNLSLGGLGDPSAVTQIQAIVEPYFAKARSLGVACIVAAGNSSGPVMYPASSSNVLAVSAIGKLGEFPADTYHAALPLAPVQSDGVFFPRFSCFGPEVGVAGPGVAIVSSIPGNNYVAWDGTSMAAPHITGLAALVLAHNPDFKESYRARNAARVDHLFNILKSSARPLNLGDPSRTGSGLPDTLVALQPRVSMGSQPLPAGQRVDGFANPTPEEIAAIARSVIEQLRGSNPSMRL